MAAKDSSAHDHPWSGRIEVALRDAQSKSLSGNSPARNRCSCNCRWFVHSSYHALIMLFASIVLCDPGRGSCYVVRLPVIVWAKTETQSLVHMCSWQANRGLSFSDEKCLSADSQCHIVQQGSHCTLNLVTAPECLRARHNIASPLWIDNYCS